MEVLIRISNNKIYSEKVGINIPEKVDISFVEGGCNWKKISLTLSIKSRGLSMPPFV